MNEPVRWMDDGNPYSPRFNDRYRSSAGGLAQAVSVFLQGCGLPERWRGQGPFTVLETGFGLGLNFLVTWAAWESDPQRCECLQFVSVEAYPVAAADIVRSAVAASLGREANAGLWAHVQVLAQELAQAWHALSPGVHDFDFAGGRVQLKLVVGEVLPMLQNLDCQADAVYLDGFSPALNPQMWSVSTLQAVAMNCRVGATLATYTVAKSVRGGLEQLGFRVEKCSGLPPKRHCLRAFYSPGA